MATFASVPTMATFLTNGYWGGTSHRWTDGSVSVNISDLTAPEQALAQTAFSQWQSVCDVNFTFTTGAADITFTNNGSGNAETSSTWWHSGPMISAAINISSDWAGGAATGVHSYFFQTYIHEIGHAIGLGHQGPYNTTGTYGISNIYTNDTWQWSVMSYFSQGNFGGSTSDYVITPQMADILAAGLLYGVQSTHEGNTTYGFNSTAGSFFNFGTYASAPAFTIYDTGGTQDCLDASGYSMDQTLNLNGGGWSSIGGYNNNVGIYTYTIVETAIGGSGNDILIGNDAANSLYGGAGNDLMHGDYVYGVDFMDGGSGLDTASFMAFGSAVWVRLTYAGREAWTCDGSNVQTGTWREIADIVNVENVTGSLYSDYVQGNGGTNVIGYTGGVDAIDGGGGIDTIDFSQFGAAVWVDLEFQGLEGWTRGTSGLSTGTWTGITDLTSMENIVGTAYADDIKGNAAANDINGGAGNDLLMGRGGNDVIHGGAGSDIAVFANVAWKYSFAFSGTSILVTGAGEGTDLVMSDVEHFQFGNLTVSRAQLIDAFTHPVVLTEGADTATLPIIGGTFNALGGNDLLKYTGGQVVIDGGAGIDTVSFANFNSAVWVNLSEPGIQAWTQDRTDLTSGTWRPLGEISNVENLIGTAHSDSLTGNNGANVLYYTGGMDKLDGLGGVDTANFSLSGSAVWVDLNYAGTEAWTRGGVDLNSGTWTEIADLANIENLVGSVHSDVLRGNADMNVLTGGAGDDVLTGGAGSDTFVFDNVTSVDTITDFVPGVDKLQVSSGGFGGGLVAGSMVTLLLGDDHSTVTNGGTGGAFILDNAGDNSGTLYWDANGGSGEDAVAFVRLQGVTSLFPSDFHVV